MLQGPPADELRRLVDALSAPAEPAVALVQHARAHLALPHEVTVRSCVAAAWTLLVEAGRCALGHDLDMEVIEAAEDWIACPCEPRRRRAWDLADLAADADVHADAADDQVDAYDLATWTGYATDDQAWGSSGLRSGARTPVLAALCCEAIRREVTEWLSGADPVLRRRGERAADER